MDTLINLLKTLAPSLATAVAGPLGGAAVSYMASRLGVEDTVVEVAKAISDDPAAAQKMRELELEFAKVDLESIKVDQANTTQRWTSDMASDSWLSKNVRPMALIALFTGYFMFALMSAYGYNANESYVTLLGNWGMLVFGAYFGSRGIEKVVEIRSRK